MTITFTPEKRDAAFMAKVAIDPAGCWRWTAGMGGDRMSYGTFFDGTRTRRAHRWAYERWVGPVPEGLELDHLCRVRECVNPAHLEPVTAKENKRRSPYHFGGEFQRAKTHCPHGHPYSGSNLYVTSRGHRRCRACCRAREHRRRKDVSAQQTNP